MLRTAKGTFLRVTLKFRKTRGIRIGFEDHQPPEVGSFLLKHLEIIVDFLNFWNLKSSVLKKKSPPSPNDNLTKVKLQNPKKNVGYTPEV